MDAAKGGFLCRRKNNDDRHLMSATVPHHHHGAGPAVQKKAYLEMRCIKMHAVVVGARRQIVGGTN